ncbi:hypothetical protein OG413_03345 [Streptomyces sp. NBC_01433]|uniref:hypothetical protein n=1 Tax=Streptomyces sp. NBC_01433 TaxID=2903864 RepID=UPI002258F478|nr:hypothetical protein [Streptomyces sp. NBC_01433]MCX4674363.1 hypothetical protein [Streptomyces sp. NBC_01433]
MNGETDGAERAHVNGKTDGAGGTHVNGETCVDEGTLVNGENPVNGSEDGRPLCVDLDGPAGESWRQCADVLRGARPRPAREAARVARRALVRYPGCLLTVVSRTDGGCTTASWLDGRPSVRVYAPGRVRPERGTTRLVAQLYAKLIEETAPRPAPTEAAPRPAPAVAPAQAVAPSQGCRTAPARSGDHVTRPLLPGGPPDAGHRPR